MYNTANTLSQLYRIANSIIPEIDKIESNNNKLIKIHQGGRFFIYRPIKHNN